MSDRGVIWRRRLVAIGALVVVAAASYWDSHWGPYLGFYARELADCAG